jgi:CRISPR-associated protein Csm3
MERVLPRVTFDFELAYRVLDTGDGGAEDEKNFHEVVLVALALVQADCLGSAGSRGCGQVRFLNLKDEAGEAVSLPRLGEAKAAG